MKRLICILLTLTLCAALILPASAINVSPDGATTEEAIAAYEAETGEKVETYRYYFQMPDGVHGIRDELGGVTESWYNEFSQGAGVYWWGDAPAACEEWAGYRALVDDAEQSIYYADVPTSVPFLIWNNGVTYEDADQAAKYVRQTITIPCEYAEPDEYDTLPEGNKSFDNCIFVPNTDISYAEYMPNRPLGGFWYHYYGGGCYGNYAKDSEHFIGTAQNCCNPDHYDKSGSHVGYTGVLRGDYDSDNTVTVLDATRVQRIIAGLFTGSNPAVIKSADADKDGFMTVLDATRIQRVLAGICDWNGNTQIELDSYELPFVPQ